MKKRPNRRIAGALHTYLPKLEGMLDAPRGFEPRLTESESVVLPLDDGATGGAPLGWLCDGVKGGKAVLLSGMHNHPARLHFRLPVSPAACSISAKYPRILTGISIRKIFCYGGFISAGAAKESKGGQESQRISTKQASANDRQGPFGSPTAR